MVALASTWPHACEAELLLFFSLCVCCLLRALARSAPQSAGRLTTRSSCSQGVSGQACILCVAPALAGPLSQWSIGLPTGTLSGGLDNCAAEPWGRTLGGGLLATLALNCRTGPPRSRG